MADNLVLKQQAETASALVRGQQPRILGEGADDGLGEGRCMMRWVAQNDVEA